MNDFIKVLTSRRSCKSFDPTKKVDEKLLDEIMLCGTYAPTGKGMQAPTIVCVQDEPTIKLLSKINADVLGVKYDPFYGATAVLVVFSDSDYFTYLEDGALVLGNMLNAAHSLGLGACWIHRAKQMFETKEGRALKTKWGLKDSLVGIGNCVLGYRLNPPTPAKPRKPDYIIKV